MTGPPSESRRDFFRRIVAKAAPVASEMLPVIELPPVRPRDPEEPPLPAAARLMTLEELGTIAREEGLGDRAVELCGLARVSFRLTERADVGHAPPPWTWGGATLDDAALTGLGVLDLRSLSGLGVPAALGDTGALAFFCDVPQQAERTGETIDCGRARVTPVDSEPAVRRATPGRRAGAVLMPELSLPRVWASSVQALELDDEERDAWARVRSQLAKRQSTTLFDEVEGHPRLHRLLGYPDERLGMMPQLCASDATHADTATAADWRLLLQITTRDVPAFAERRGRHERLYLWITEQALISADFSNVRAFAH